MFGQPGPCQSEPVESRPGSATLVRRVRDQITEYVSTGGAVTIAITILE